MKNVDLFDSIERVEKYTGDIVYNKCDKWNNLYGSSRDKREIMHIQLNFDISNTDILNTMDMSEVICKPQSHNF